MHNTEEHIEKTPTESEGLIKTPRQLITVVILAFLVPITVIVMLVNMVDISSSRGAGSDTHSDEAIAQRLQPVAGFKLVDASAPVESMTGQQVYELTCATCHAAGVAGAPKLGDEAAWAPLIDSGFDTMVRVAIEGINAMPPRGGNSALSDLEMARAVAYMANQSGGSFPEPEEDGEADADATADAPAPAQAEAEAETETQAEADSSAEQVDQDSQEQSTATDADTEAGADQAGADDATEQAEQAAAAQGDPEQAASGQADLDLAAGEQLYNSVCFACHATGVANAPKLGDKAAWQPYIDSGFDSMMEKIISGVGAMPPRGGSTASDEELEAALAFMLSKVE